MRRGLVLLVGVLALAAPVVAEAKVGVKVRPADPTRGRDITAEFRTDRTQPRGYHYEAYLGVTSRDRNCTRQVIVKSGRRYAKGKRVKLTLHHKTRQGRRFCRGRASVVVALTK